MNGGYCSLFQDRMLVYQGKQNLFKRLGKYLFNFNLGINMSKNIINFTTDNNSNNFGK